jgi:hypothetical protein
MFFFALFPLSFAEREEKSFNLAIEIKKLHWEKRETSRDSLKKNRE